MASARVGTDRLSEEELGTVRAKLYREWVDNFDVKYAPHLAYTADLL